MKPKICIVGYQPVINIAKKVSREFKGQAEFIFICSLMEQALPLLREVEGVVQMVLAGPSTRRMYANQLKVPILAFRPTFPDMIQAIKEAQKISGRVGICLSREDREFDLPLLSEVMNVSLEMVPCDTSREYADACRRLKDKGYKVIIGGSFTVEAAEKLGIKGILLFKGMDMIRSAIASSLELYQVQQESMLRISQLNAVVNNISEGLFLTDQTGRIILDNPLAQKRLNSKDLVGEKIQTIFKSDFSARVLAKGHKILNVLESNGLVANYMPVRSAAGLHGVVCTFKRVDEIEDAEFSVRERLHHRGFAAKYNLNGIIGGSSLLRECKERAIRFAQAEDPILITGASGTGKELFAHAIHTLSRRAKGPFVAINCATLPGELLESELFGYEKGAFTGAHATGKKGLIELAHKGTLFLDEITTMSYPLQAKLLRLLSEREILKLGSDRIIPIDVRILAATNENIEANVEERRFREDLYYRLNVFRLTIPALRERPDDIEPLFLYFVSRINPDIHREIIPKKKMITRSLLGQPFKGNARELENVAKRFCLLYLSEKASWPLDKIINLCLEKDVPPEAGDVSYAGLKATREEKERQLIQGLLKKHRYKTDVARVLGISLSTLWRKIKRYEIQA
jgi:propionate catabolism operon transcriptional regulator